MPIDDKPSVVRSSIFSVQVCVPAAFSDDEAKQFAEEQYPCGTANGWQVRQEAPIRCQCEQRAGFVHIMLDA